MSKEELLKYLIAEIDLIMHDKDYRFENANGTWYSRESCRDLTNEEVFEELRTELRQFADLETKLAESEKSKESYRLQNEQHHLQLLQFYSRLGVEAFGADIHEKALETLMIMKEQLAEKDLAIENWQTMYESVVQTCHNDKEEIERLNKQLAEKEKEIQRTHNYYQAVRNRETIRESKISFALEQLEWLKEKVNNAKIHKIDMINTHELYEILDNQIKQLKEMK